MAQALTYRLRNVAQVYAGRSVLAVEALDIVPGECLGLVGPSGAGKSTLLRLLGLLEMPTTGEMAFAGQLAPAKTWPLALRRQVILVFQQPALLDRSVAENVALGLQLRGGAARQAQRQKVAAALEQVGLSALATTAAKTLSGGEVQRVALARALICEPAVLLLDEPTANLDPYNVNLIETIVRDHNARYGTTVVFVTHNLFQAQRLAHRVGLLLNGQLIETAPTAEFFAQPKDTRTRAFVRGEFVY